MELQDIETLRCSLRLEVGAEGPQWVCSHGSVAYRSAEGTWYGPLVNWSGDRSVAHEVIRGTLEAVLDAGVDAVEVSPDDVEGWDPERLGFEHAWARKKPGVWRFDVGCVVGGVEHAFEGMVLSLSGGGVRAVAFGLGVFDALGEVELLARVRCVTAVSGGALLAGAWTASRATGEGYPEFRERLRDFLVGERHEPVKAGSRSLIRRYADLLSERLLGEPDGEAHTLGSVPQEPEVVFQTTELTRAGSFVLAVGSRVSQGSPGKLALPGEQLTDVRLADAMAASAAYPVGFEPFVFPRDFALPPEVERTLAGAIHQARARGSWPVSAVDGVPLVDGGVFDNQGVHAALNAARRHKRDAELLLVADAAVTEPERAVWVPGQLEPDASVLAGLLAGVSVLVTVGWLLTALLPPWGVVLTVFGFFTVAAFLVPPLAVEQMRRTLPPDLPMVGFRTPTGFIHGAGLRAGVAVVLLRDVFLERLRSMRYSQMFDRELHAAPAFVRIQDLLRVADASEGSLLGALQARHPVPGDLQERTRRCSRVPTALYLQGGPVEARRVLEDLVIVGRATTLYKLLLFCETTDRPRSRALRRLRDALAARVDALHTGVRRDNPESGEPSRA